MTTLSHPTGPLASPARASAIHGLSVPARHTAVKVLSVLLLAGAIRFGGLGATFESSDQAAMPHMVAHHFGIRWLFAHDYGPVLPAIQRFSAEVLGRLGMGFTEASGRLPIALISLAQVVLAFPLLRRLGSTVGEALLGMLCCALLPTLVCDAHYAWGYLTVWLFTGTLALWGTLAWLDDRRPIQLAAAGVGLMLHCMGNVYAFAVPATLLWVWSREWWKPARSVPAGHRRQLGSAVMIGWALPCMAALAVIVGSWRWTGGGPLGRLLSKHHGGTTGLQWHQITQLPLLWSSQLGYVFGIIAAIGLLWGVRLLWRRDGGRIGLLAVWALVGAVPLVLLADWSRIGYPGAYFIECVFAAGMLGAVLLHRACRVRSWPLRTVAQTLAVIAFLHLAGGSTGDVLLGGRFASLTGVSTGWGSVRPDTGVKAAGWYVRENVPLEATILVLHDNKGMEAPVAELYTGRCVLASYDLRREWFDALLTSMADDIDVLILEGRERLWGDDLPGFERVCTLRRDWQPVRMIYARRELHLPQVDEDVRTLNSLYDAKHHPARVPIALPAGPAFDQKLNRYQVTIAALRKQALNRLSVRH